MTLKDRFVKKLTEALEAHGWTDADLAREMGVSRQFVGQYRSGNRTPGIDVAERFANALGLDDPAALIDKSEILQSVA